MLCNSCLCKLINMSALDSAGGSLNSASASAVNCKSVALNETRSMSYQEISVHYSAFKACIFSISFKQMQTTTSCHYEQNWCKMQNEHNNIT